MSVPVAFNSRAGRGHRHWAVQALGLLVAANGLYILAGSLIDELTVHRDLRLNLTTIDVPLLIGISMIYLGALLRRRKRTAWAVTIAAYVFYLGTSVDQLVDRFNSHMLHAQELVRLLILPLVIIGLLFAFRDEFVVKSDIRGFRFAARFSVIVLAIALLYGVTGFMLLDKSDFHQEIGLPTAIHYTVDQFNLTTTHPIQPYTRRAKVFVDSLSVVSTAAVAYALFSLFQPLRTRFSDQHADREHMSRLLHAYGAPSEEFFKLWPHDKQYFFDLSGQSGLAFHVQRGVALCVSDPAGDPAQFEDLLSGFDEMCFNNDWLPALVHTADDYADLYARHGFTLQRLGQEAILNLEYFQTEVVKNKYFRQIGNKFARHNYSCELLSPPHHQAVIDRLEAISNDWLSRGGRAERGLVMGYYTPSYLQNCQVLVARDAAGTIQAFVNLVPADFDRKEATYDMLRYAGKCLGNINDYLLMNLTEQLQANGYQRLNLGLCPLAGLDQETDQEKNSLIDGFLRFAYANGDRFYSFSGLHRFKAKYEPEWHDKYVAYKGGVRGFSRTMTALMLAMRVKAPR